MNALGNGKKVGIVGLGIVGLAHAWASAKRGHRVQVFERAPRASGASIRNFGMVWPIGQPPGDAYSTALRSRACWLELAREAGLWVHPCGSIHLAHREDEWNVLQEFCARSSELGYACRLLSRAEVLQQTPAANPEGLLGGLQSSAELCVNPRKALRMLPDWLARRYGVQVHFETTITDLDGGWVRSSEGKSWDFDQVIVCGGSDFETLFPEVFRNSGLKRCKLQMLRTNPQPNGWKLGPHLASGLTLRHYASFEACETLPRLRQRIANETPELDQYGIHVMASQNDEGSVILGDSHEYDSAIEPFDKSEIDRLILRELQKMIQLPDWEIAERWHGVYAKNPAGPTFEAEPLPGVFIRTGTGGSGMTMAFGLAEQAWENWS